jgi:hypothetical protein
MLGQLGKAFFQMTRLFFFSWLALTISGCHNEAADALQSGKVMGFIGLEGRWAGPVVPNSDGCGQTTKGQMSVDRRTFAFDPFQGTTVISGTVSDTDALEGSLSRPGGGQETVSISFSGAVDQHDGGGETIDGQLLSGHCTWAVSLKRG